MYYFLHNSCTLADSWSIVIVFINFTTELYNLLVHILLAISIDQLVVCHISELAILQLFALILQKVD